MLKIANVVAVLLGVALAQGQCVARISRQKNAYQKTLAMFAARLDLILTGALPCLKTNTYMILIAELLNAYKSSSCSNQSATLMSTYRLRQAGRAQG